MQVLKERVRNTILSSARSEFREKGFKNSSMREIARGAGVTAGNLYRYFENKEELFCTVVGPAYKMIVDLVEEVKEVSFNVSPQYPVFMEEITHRIVDIYRNNREELLILVKGSQGTRFEKAKENVVLLLEKKLRDILGEHLQKKNKGLEDDYLFYVIAYGFIEGLIIILERFEEEEKMNSLIGQYICFNFKNIWERFE